MSRADLFQLVQIVYWLSLATWFGGALFVAMAVPAIFRTVGENNPVLPHVLSVNLEGQHGTLLSGSIVGALYATGMSPEEMDKVLSTTDWDDALQDEESRPDIPYRLKQDDGL